MLTDEQKVAVALRILENIKTAENDGEVLGLYEAAHTVLKFSPECTGQERNNG